MKKIVLILAVMLMLSATVASAGVLNGYYEKHTLISAATATGSGPAVPLYIPLQNHLISVVWSGTTPTNVVVTFDCSGDGTNFNVCDTETITASPTIFHVSKPSILWIRGTYSSKSGGDTTTAVTMTSVDGGL